MLIFLLQCPPKWTNLQAVVSRGPNPLPAEVRIKRHPQYGDDFFFLDKAKWEVEKFPFKTYADPLQVVMRKLIGRSLIMAFRLFDYVETTDHKMYVATLPLPHDACIQRLVQIVRAEEQRCCEEIYQDSNIPSMGNRAQFRADFKSIIDKITIGFIAKQILSTMSTVQVGKNWNSHGADLGSALCQISAILSSLDNANDEPKSIQEDLQVLIPQGNIQTGHKHGHHDVVYVEYMTAVMAQLPETGGKQNYLTHGNFVKNKHGAKVAAIFDKKCEGSIAPVPRPTRSHTFDFNLTYCGARLIDGECKGTPTEDEKCVLVLHTLDQLALKDTALGVLTTNNTFAFYKSWLEPATHMVKTEYDESSKFSLGPVYDITTDPGTNVEQWKTPPSFDTVGDAACSVYSEECDIIVDAWQNLRSELRQFLSALIYSIDVLTLQISLMQVEEVAQKRVAAYKSGWEEPRFNASENPLYKSNREIENQEDFIYSESRMERDDDAVQPGTSR